MTVATVWRTLRTKARRDADGYVSPAWLRAREREESTTRVQIEGVTWAWPIPPQAWTGSFQPARREPR